MPYSKFKKIDQLNQFNLIFREQTLFEKIEPKEISTWLQTSLEIAKKSPLGSEKAISEAIVYPILAELKNNHDQISVHSGSSIDADKTKGLNGELDFVLSIQDDVPFILAPVFALVEAKDGIIKNGYAQCIAQMLGSQLFNKQQAKHEYKNIYGCITNGSEWQFLKLEDQTVWIDEKRYYIDRVELILGVLEAIVREFI